MSTPTEQQLAALLESLADTHEREIDCDTFLARVAAFVEHVGAGQEIGEAFLAEAQHIRICADCREEFEALLAMIRER